MQPHSHNLTTSDQQTAAGHWQDGVDFNTAPVQTPPMPPWRQACHDSAMILGDEDLLACLQGQPLLLDDGTMNTAAFYVHQAAPPQASAAMALPLQQQAFLMQARNEALQALDAQQAAHAEKQRELDRARAELAQAVQAHAPPPTRDRLQSEVAKCDAACQQAQDALTREHAYLQTLQSQVAQGQARVLRMLKGELPAGTLMQGNRVATDPNLAMQAVLWALQPAQRYPMTTLLAFFTMGGTVIHRLVLPQDDPTLVVGLQAVFVLLIFMVEVMGHRLQQ